MTYRIIIEPYRTAHGSTTTRAAYRDRADAEALHARLMAQREPTDDCTYTVEVTAAGRYAVAVIDALDRVVIGYL